MEFDLRTDDLSATDLEDNFDKNDTSPEVQTLKKNVKRTSPTGKLIDIATNDLMKFQQGVFLLLSDFNLVNRLYLTKNVRNSFKITKYILSKGLRRSGTDDCCRNAVVSLFPAFGDQKRYPIRHQAQRNKPVKA